MRDDLTATNNGHLPLEISSNMWTARLELECSSYTFPVHSRMPESQDFALLRRLVFLGLVGASLLDITQSQRTSLLGSSFGLPNVNATFDYVVEDPRSIDKLTS